jgi:hypothetical protein
VASLLKLERLSLDSNELSGPIGALSKLASLYSLYLTANQLTGPIDALLVKLTSLRNLDLEHNHLNGSIPSAISELTGLVDLLLGDNLFTGTVPHEMLQLKKLRFFTLDTNRLTGKLPAFDFAQFTGCCYMYEDLFTCPLPAGANVSCVGGPGYPCRGVLKAPTCTMPCTGSSSALIAGDCRAWQTFSRNPAYKEWAEGKCGANVHTDPCNCTFDGKVGCANSRITKLSMASQGLPGSGGIPVALLDLTGLEFFDLKVNRLSGTIPSQLTALVNLSLFDVNINHLTGAVPSLPFKQFTGNCCLNSQRTNNFTCPLPAGAADCKCNDGAGLVYCEMPK